jgi:hypothetical protein
VSSVNHTWDGPALDGTVQYITERPELEEDAKDTVYVTEPEPPGEETTENVPSLDGRERRPDATGQTTWDDWREA